MLAARLYDHANFLRNVVGNVQQLKSVPDHYECKFAKWRDKYRDQFDHLPSYAVLYDVHKQFHEDANKFVEECSISSTRNLLHSSKNVLAEFMKFSEEITNKS